MIIETYSYPRAAVIGNPSDGYFGKTIAFVFSNFEARVQLYQTPELEILPERLDGTHFTSMKELVEDVNFAGYYGGMRLLKGMIKVFYEYCNENKIHLNNRNFTIRYKSNIPLRLGLAGSSAIITACLKALTLFYNIDIPNPIFANLVLSVETQELGISAGLQDRVAQAYETPVFMDFDREIMEDRGYGNYDELDAKNFPHFYIAYRKNLSEGTEVVHNNLKARFEIGDPKVLQAMLRWGQITEDFRTALNESDYDTMHKLIDENFDLRRKTVRISKGNIEMVELARSVGASAKFTGSGGAIIGTYKNEAMFNQLQNTLSINDINVIKPNIVNI
ncbi:MAG: GHMP kinase [Bacteroidota bacterium]